MTFWAGVAIFFGLACIGCGLCEIGEGLKEIARAIRDMGDTYEINLRDDDL
jgi:hypothetical protein